MLAPGVGIARTLQSQLRALELHVEQCLLNFEIRHAVQLARQAEPAGGLDQPLGGIELPPAHAVAIVGLKLVVEVVVTLAPGQDRKSTRLNSSHVKSSYAVF